MKVRTALEEKELLTTLNQRSADPNGLVATDPSRRDVIWKLD